MDLLPITEFPITEFLVPNGPTLPKTAAGLAVDGAAAAEDEAALQTDDDYVINLITEMNQDSPTSGRAVEVTDVIYQDSFLFQDGQMDNKGLITLSPADVTMLQLPAYETIVGSPYSPCPSETSTSSYENLNNSTQQNNAAQSPTHSDDYISQAVSPVEVFGERKRKRGRRPKSEAGQNLPKVKKQKIYEISQPFENKEMERKRLNAVNAKRHRDMQKQAKESMEHQLQEVKNERDMLRKQVQELQEREALIKTQMMGFKEKLRSLFTEVENGSLLQ